MGYKLTFYSDSNMKAIEESIKEIKEGKVVIKTIENFESAILKMHHLNLDLGKDDFSDLFSSTGRPSNIQPQLFRSLLLYS